MEQGLEPCTYFNPRSPHRERRCHAAYRQLQMKFQSTLPSQGATNAIAESSNTSAISIHAPLTGSDYQRCLKMDKRNYFNPRSPHRERLDCLVFLAVLFFISIHAPLTGSDTDGQRGVSSVLLFQSTLPSQGATGIRRVPWRLCL